MRKYLFIIQEEEGCDYTIGCGITYKEVLGNNIIEAYKKIQEYFGIDSDFVRHDSKLIDIRCYDITESEFISFEELKEELKEYNEYLKLKEKFEEKK